MVLGEVHLRRHPVVGMAVCVCVCCIRSDGVEMRGCVCACLQEDMWELRLWELI